MASARQRRLGARPGLTRGARRGRQSILPRLGDSFPSPAFPESDRPAAYFARSECQTYKITPTQMPESATLKVG